MNSTEGLFFLYEVSQKCDEIDSGQETKGYIIWAVDITKTRTHFDDILGHTKSFINTKARYVFSQSYVLNEV